MRTLMKRRIVDTRGLLTDRGRGSGISVLYYCVHWAATATVCVRMYCIKKKARTLNFPPLQLVLPPHKTLTMAFTRYCPSPPPLTFARCDTRKADTQAKVVLKGGGCVCMCVGGGILLAPLPKNVLSDLRNIALCALAVWRIANVGRWAGFALLLGIFVIGPRNGAHAG